MLRDNSGPPIKVVPSRCGTGRRRWRWSGVPSNKTERPGPLVSGRNGQLWFVGETIRNLTTGVEFRDRQIYDRFQPTASYEDTRGHFWVAKLGQGLVEWIPEPS